MSIPQIYLYTKQDERVLIRQNEISEIELWINRFYTGLIPISNKGVLSLRNVEKYELVKSVGDKYNLIVKLNPEDFI